MSNYDNLRDHEVIDSFYSSDEEIARFKRNHRITPKAGKAMKAAFFSLLSLPVLGIALPIGLTVWSPAIYFVYIPAAIIFVLFVRAYFITMLEESPLLSVVCILVCAIAVVLLLVFSEALHFPVPAAALIPPLAILGFASVIKAMQQTNKK